MKSAGIVRVSSVKNVGDVVRYNEQEQKISGRWNGQEHDYRPTELCTYQGASANGPSLTQRGTAFARNGVNNRRLYHMEHPRGNANNTMARTIIQSFDHRLNPDLTPGDVHSMGIMFSDKLKRYFGSLGRPVNDMLVSTHLDRQQPKPSNYEEGKVLQPHLHSHILVHSFNTQGEALAPLLKKTNLHDIQDLNDQVTDSFDLKDYRFAKLQHLAYPMSAKTSYRTRLDARRSSDLDKASQRYLNANRVARRKHPDNFNQALQYRDRLLEYNFGYRTKQVASLRRINSRQLFTMKDFHDDKGRPTWYNTENMKVLQWKSQQDAEVERFITHLDFNHATGLTPTHREYKKTIQYATQADRQTQLRLQGRTNPRMKMEKTSGADDRASSPDLSSHVRIRSDKQGMPHYRISLQSIFQRVRREEERIKEKANEYVRKIKVQIDHVKARMERRRQARTRTHMSAMQGDLGGRDYRSREIYQYITFYGADRHGKIQPHRVKQSIHPRTPRRTSRPSNEQRPSQERSIKHSPPHQRHRPHRHL